MKRKESGITLIVLIIIVIVLIIIASITAFEGKELISKSKIQTLETNMLTIQAKAKAYAEEIDAKIWTESDSQSDVDGDGNTPKDIARNSEFTSEKIGFTGPISVTNQEALRQASQGITSSNYVAYEVTGNALINMGLKDIKNENYVVIYSKENYKLMDVIYPNGVNYKGTMHFTLSNLQSILSDE